ncbi:MAG: ATP-binding protein, partial [Marmoricola sp.]|nr:ATP-binding protein [Marmoricola sp.]
MNASGRFTSHSLPPAEVNTTLTPAADLDRPSLTWDAALLAMAGDAMAEAQGALFDERFLERHAGEIIRDPEIAIVELVANAWDAWATRVDIRWAERGNEQVFSITDNGKGMAKAQFERRWRTLDYNKLTEEGVTATPPDELKEFAPRRSDGRNGKGRHAAFRFGDPYVVRTWCDGHEVTYEVQRGINVPFDLKLVSERNEVLGHGTEISAPGGTGVNMTAQQVREVIGTRFLADPNFQVVVDGTKVTFEDVPAGKLRELEVEVPGFGVAQLIVIDTQKADRTTRQHGIAWWVDNRLVGRPGWTDFELDGRTNEAKRFQFIVRADFLAQAAATLPDWSGF